MRPTALEMRYNLREKLNNKEEKLFDSIDKAIIGSKDTHIYIKDYKSSDVPIIKKEYTKRGYKVKEYYDTLGINAKDVIKISW